MMMPSAHLQWPDDDHSSSDHRHRSRRHTTSTSSRRIASPEEPKGGGTPPPPPAGLVVLTCRPKGGGRSLCMDLEEVKACQDLGFDLEDCRYSTTTTHALHHLIDDDDDDALFTTTGGGGNIHQNNSAISNPGDDPRHVKARLKVWAQAVALASSSPRHPSSSSSS